MIKIKNLKNTKENRAWRTWEMLEKAYNQYQDVFGLRDERAEQRVVEAKAEALSYVTNTEISWYSKSGKLPDFLRGDVRIIIFAGIVTITSEFYQQESYKFIEDEWYSDGYRKLTVEKYGEQITLHLFMAEDNFKFYDGI